MHSTRRNSNLVSIQHKQATATKYGKESAWVEFCRVWVSINPDRGREIYKGDEKRSVVTHTVRGDYLELEGVTEEMRVVVNDLHSYDPPEQNSKVFEIVAVMTDFDEKKDVMLQVEMSNLDFGQHTTATST